MGIELCGFGFCRFRYYRLGLLSVLDMFLGAMGVRLRARRILGYGPTTHALRLNLVSR